MRRSRTESDQKTKSPLDNLLVIRSKSKDGLTQLKNAYRSSKEKLIPGVIGTKIIHSPHNHFVSPSPSKNYNFQIKIPIKSRTPNNKSPVCQPHSQRQIKNHINVPQPIKTQRQTPKIEQLKKKQFRVNNNNAFRPLNTQKFFKKEKQIQKKVENSSHLSQTLKMIWQRKPKKNTILANPQFKILKALGQSQTGQILCSLSLQTNMLLALKTFKISQVVKQYLLDQLKIHLFCHHPHILPAYGYHITKEEVYLMMEVGQTSLYQVMVKRGRFGEEEVAEYVRQVAQGVAYLHSLGVMHRDIKPENIIVVGGCLKIADFGWSVRTNMPRKTLCGTLDYLSPQVSSRAPYTNKIDCWSIGVLMYQLLTGHPPFPQQQEYQQCDFSQLKVPPKLSTLGKDLLEKLLEKDAEERISAVEILEHGWIRKYGHKRDYEEDRKWKVVREDIQKVLFQ